MSEIESQLDVLKESVYDYEVGSISLNYLGEIGGTYVGGVVVSPQVAMAVVGRSREELRFTAGI
jgi:pyruvate/2-oxoglutarate dehydrogenase complex dihydrolipoamide acyltransferase (E2) component